MLKMKSVTAFGYRLIACAGVFVKFEWGEFKTMAIRCRDAGLGAGVEKIFSNACRIAAVACVVGMGTFGVSLGVADSGDASSESIVVSTDEQSSGEVSAAVEPSQKTDAATQALIDALEKMNHFQADFAQFTQDSEGTVLQERV